MALFVVAGAAKLPWGAGGEYTAAGWTLQHLAYGAIGLLAVIAAVSADDRPAGAVRLLAARPLTWLGLISYGIFLWHVPVLIGYQKMATHGWMPASGIPALAFTLAVTIPIAAGSWYLIERPALRERRRELPAAAEGAVP